MAWRWTVVALGCAFVACVDEHHAVVSTAGIAEEPWKCPEAGTTVVNTAYGRYRLTGCNTTAVYECNFALQPPRCWLK
jgi:hypothetical protein